MSSPTRGRADISIFPRDSSVLPSLKPALALVLRPDGSVVLHNEADDEANDVRRDIETNYKHEINQSTKKRERRHGLGHDGHDGRQMGGRKVEA